MYFISRKKKSLFKKSLATAVASLLALPAIADWKVENGKLLDPNGQPFIFRGVTVDHFHAPDKAVQAIKDAAAAGANAVQVEMGVNVYKPSTQITGEQLRAVILACKDNKVICVLEPTDIGGYPAPGSITPDTTITGFYSSPEIRNVIDGEQDYVILSLGNQAIGDVPLPDNYVNRMESHVPRFFSFLPRFMVMIDGSGWGQDVSREMLTFAVRSKQRGGRWVSNVIYSVEMYDAYTDPAAVHDYIAAFTQLGAPLVIGGFAPTPYYHPNYTHPIPAVAPSLPAALVMDYAQQYGAGYFAWNWSGSANPGLNLTTDWDPNTLTAWGELAINDTNGIKATAKRATHFQSSSSSSSSPNGAPTAYMSTAIEKYDCGPVIGVASATGSADPDGDKLLYNWEVNTEFGESYKLYGLTVRFAMEPVRTYTVTLEATDGRGGSASTVKTMSHSFWDPCGSSSSSSSIRSSSSSVPSSSSSVATSSSIKSSRASSSAAKVSSSSSSSRSSSSVAARASCSYVVNSQWGNGFTAAIRIRNTTASVISGWNVNWQYADGSKITGSWNATLSGTYSAKNLNWNANIQPGQTVEFGFQGSKPSGAASVPIVSGSVCQ